MCTRPTAIWTIFGSCFAVLLLAMAWVTNHTLRLEDSRIQNETERELQERVRLALWRMDSAAGALVFAESARPPGQFKDFHAVDQAYTNTFQIVQKGQVIEPSPLLNTIPGHVKLYCQTGADGGVTSPQVPSGNNRDLAEQNYLSREEIDSAAALLQQACQILPAPSPKVTPDHGQEPLPQSADWSAEEVKNTSEYFSRSKQAAQNKIWAQ